MGRSCFAVLLSGIGPATTSKPTEPTQKHAALRRNAFPGLGACTVSSGRPWSAGPWRLEPIPLVRRPERSPKPPENDTHQPLKPRWRQSSERRKALQPNYSRSIAVQENALRVMWLMLGASGGTPAEQRLLGRAAVSHRPRKPQAHPEHRSKRLAMSGATIFPASGLAPLAPERPGVHHNGGRSQLAGDISRNEPETTRK